MKKESFKIQVNNVDFYCEKEGEGPTLVLVPDGCNDCGPFHKVMSLLSQHFTVITFDMRGGTRSMDFSPQKVTPKSLADDVAGIIKALDLGPASVYGCSSGGQTVLALGKYHKDLVRNIMVHEAALQSDTPLKDAGFIYFDNINTLMDHAGEMSDDLWGIGNWDGFTMVDDECNNRIRENSKFWGQYYRGTVDVDQYTKEDFETMPPTAFTVGTWTPSWLVYANLKTAERGNCPVTWLHSSHHPERTCPEALAVYIKSTIEKHL